MNRRKGLAAALAAATGLAAAVSPAARAELHFTPSVGVSETWTDNYFLAGPGEPKDGELVTRTYAQLVLSQRTQRTRANLSYDIDAVLNGPGDNATYQNGRLDLGAEAVRDWLFLDAAGAYGQYSIEPGIRRDPDHIFPTRDSLTDVGSGTLTGSLRHNLGRVHFEAAYIAGTVRFAKEPDAAVGARALQDSNSREASFALSSLGDSRLFWGATYREQRVEYDGGLEVVRDFAGLDLAFAVASQLKLLARGGLESDPFRFDDSGGLDESNWAAGFAYQYRRGELRLMAGRGVYGDTYDGTLTANGRIAKVDLSYHEQTTTQIQQFLPYLATDPAGNPIVVGGNTVLSGLDDPFARLTPDVFRQQELRGRVSLVGRLTSVELELRSERRNYLISDATDTVHSAYVTIGRTLGPRSRAQLTARYETVNLANADRFHDQQYSLSLHRQLGQRLQLVASASRARSTSSDPYAANWVVLALQMNLGRGGGDTLSAPGNFDYPAGSR